MGQTDFCEILLPYTRGVPQIQGDEIWKFGSENWRGFLVANFWLFSPGEKAQNLSPKTSPHSSLHENKFVTWNSLWEHPRLLLPPNSWKRFRSGQDPGRDARLLDGCARSALSSAMASLSGQAKQRRHSSYLMTGSVRMASCAQNLLAIHAWQWSHLCFWCVCVCVFSPSFKVLFASRFAIFL